jgi:hypothetical protein
MDSPYTSPMTLSLRTDSNNKRAFPAIVNVSMSFLLLQTNSLAPKSYKVAKDTANKMNLKNQLEKVDNQFAKQFQMITLTLNIENRIFSSKCWPPWLQRILTSSGGNSSSSDRNFSSLGTANFAVYLSKQSLSKQELWICLL